MSLTPTEIKWLYKTFGDASLSEEEFGRLYESVANGDDEQSVLTRLLISDYIWARIELTTASRCIGIELNPDFLKLAHERCAGVQREIAEAASVTPGGFGRSAQ